MFVLPRLRHGAATRLLRCPTSGTRELTVCSLANRDVSYTPQAPTSHWSPLPRSSIQGKRSVARELGNSRRCISIEAPREPTAGSEPGVNIHNEDAWPQWRAKVQSQITAVDFSKDRIEKYELTNETLEEFLAKPREDWATCRWINGKSLFTLYGS